MINDCGIIDCGRKPGRISKSGGFVWARLDRVFTNPACCYDLWESLSEMERVHYFPWLFCGDPNEVANGEVENGSTALRRFFSSKIPRNRDNKR